MTFRFQLHIAGQIIEREFEAKDWPAAIEWSRQWKKNVLASAQLRVQAIQEEVIQ